MLCGMSLELLFKAIVVAKDGEPDKNSHDLPALAKSAGVPVTDKQAGLLKLLSQYVIWAGRYPVPKSKDKYDKLASIESQHLWITKKVAGSKFLKERLSDTQLDWEPFHQLWKHANDIYRQHE